MTTINLVEAADVWLVAHTMLKIEEGGTTLSLNESGSGSGCGDSKHIRDWCCNVRGLVKSDLDTFVLDCVYGDSNVTPNMRSRRSAVVVLRQFRDKLCDKMDIYNSYPRMRRFFFDD